MGLNTLISLLMLLGVLLIGEAKATSWVGELGLSERPTSPTAQARLGKLWVDSITKDLFFLDSDGNNFNVLLGGLGGASLNDLSDVDTFTASPTVGQALAYDGANWVPMSVSGKILVAGQGVTIIQDATTATFSSSGKDLVAGQGIVITQDATTATISSSGKTLVGSSPIVITQDASTATLSLGVADYIDYNISGTLTVPHVVGRTHWNATDKAIEIDIDAINNISQTVGEELYVDAFNLTGSQINDGQVVYINGSNTDFPTVALASSTTYNQTIGIATQNIPNGERGKVTINGKVGGYDTSGFITGDALYLSPSIAGALTKVRPASNIVQVARAMNSMVSGKILVDVKPTGDNLTLDPTGFLNPAGVIVNYDQTTRKVTLTGDVRAVWKNYPVAELFNGYVSPAHTNSNGSYYLYYNGTSIVWSTTPWSFDQLMIAYVYFDGVDNIGLREVHGIMNWNSHEEFHRTIGTFLKSGGDVLDYTLASTTPTNRRPHISSAEVLDEDLQTTIPALSTESYTRFFLSGVDVGNFSLAQTDIVNVTATRPNYNQFTGGNWVQTPMTANAYQAIFLLAIPVESSVNSQKYRFVWVQGQTESTNLATIEALTPASLNLNGLNVNVAEYVFIAKIILRYVGVPTNNWNLISVSKLSGTRYNQTSVIGSYLSTVTSDASFTGDGTPASPLALSGTVTTTGYHYYGTDTDNSFRTYQSGGALITEKKISGVWTEVSRSDNL